MLELITNRGDIRNELWELIRCFVPDTAHSEAVVNCTYIGRRNEIAYFITVDEKTYVFRYPQNTAQTRIDYVRYDIYAAKHALYRAMSDALRKELPWGSLTGIRPTRVAAKILQRGVAPQNVAATLSTEYFVSAPKAALAAEILQEQQRYVQDRMALAADGAQELVNLYVHIPFCPTRCAYCSFVSEGIERKSWLLLPYADALVKEINRTKAWLQEHGKRIFSVYVGGGTPTVLPPDLLEKVLRAAEAENAEYTCEAGRPDTITDEKLHILKECGVNRTSINPQTLHDATLKRIGRAHTAAQFFSAYRAAETYGFVKNVDLIAGLEDETAEDFRYTLDTVLALAPENITVHTLCRKRGSTQAQTEIAQNEQTERMVDYSIAALKSAGYTPYYLYRQKQMTGNLENIGWCKNGFLCVNNVTVMEEMLSVYACGAGAIGKMIFPEGKILRHANPKDVLLYLKEFEERMEKKEIFYQNQFTSDL